MKLIATIILVMFVIMPAVFADIIITEVLYDPLTSESDTEFIELFNTGDTAANISGWSLNTTTQQAVLPQNTLIKPNSYFLISDGHDADSWPAEWPEVDYQDELTLPNTNSGIRLIDANHNVVDAVGWGNPAAGLYLGTAHSHVPEGDSLARRSQDGSFFNTRNNTYDFLAALPTPKNSHAGDEPTKEIIIHASVQGNPPSIDKVTLVPDDSEADGTQILPLPGKTKNLTITVSVSDNDGYTDINSVHAKFDQNNYYLTPKENLNLTSSTYSGTLPLDFYMPPGTYQLNLVVNDSFGLISTKNLSFEYLSMLAFKIDSAGLFFEGISGQHSDILGDLDISTAQNPTLMNLGNTELDFRLSGTDLDSSHSIISSDNLLYTFLDDDFTSALSGNLSYTPVLKDLNLGPGAMSLRELSLRLLIPPGTTAGDYTGTLYLTGVIS